MIPAWKDIQNTLCRKCIDGDGSGRCRLPVDEECALQRSFLQVVQTIQRVNSSNFDDYALALRKDVCASCMYQDVAGMCQRRDHLECALDRYFPLVIEIIEKELETT